MPLIQTDSQHYSDIADAIRIKLNSQDTYYPADMKPAILSIPQNIQDKDIYYDFTKNMFDQNHFTPCIIRGCTSNPYANGELSQNGFYMHDGSQEISLPIELLQFGVSYKLEILSLDIQDTTRHNTIFQYQGYHNGSLSNSRSGFKFRSQTQKWSLWDDNNLWQDSDIADKNYFNNSILRIDITKSGLWKIYKDDVLVFEPSLKPTITNAGTFGIGQNINRTGVSNMLLKSLRISLIND